MIFVSKSFKEKKNYREKLLIFMLLKFQPIHIQYIF